MAQEVSRQYRIPIFKTIDEALCLGGKRLAVDAVLSIGEHGQYPTNELGQTEYPRKRFFDAIVAVMRRSRRFVPLYNDKHLSSILEIKTTDRTDCTDKQGHPHPCHQCYPWFD